MNILKEKRQEKNMTLEEVGKLVGVGKSTVRKWENGLIENMGRDKIVLLSKALNISPLDILGVDNDEPETTLTLINDTSKQLNDDKQVEVLEFAKQKLTEQESNVVEFPQQVVDLSNTTMFAFDGKEISAEDRKVIEKVIQDRLNKQNKKNGDDIE